MVLLAAAICTKAGKAIISRQFVEMSRSRIEGLLGAFPKLMNTGKQHTFVETESVRYVYQPLDTLYMLLITTKASNILEDLETLRLFSRVVPEYCRVMEESEVIDKSFQLIFAFDEIVALGYRENVNLAQIRTFTEMESQEEKMFESIRKAQIREANEVMKRKSKELTAARLAIAKGKAPRSAMSGFGGSTKQDYNHTVEITPEPTVPKPSKPIRPTGSNKAMKLGSKGKDVDHFVDKLRSEGADITTSSGKLTAVTKSSQPAVPTSAVHIRVDEKISLKAGKDGGLQEMEVRGMILLRISDAEYANIAIAVENNDTRGFRFQTHPNVDSKKFNQSSVLCVKQAKQSGKAFPLNADIGVLRWSMKSTDEALMPLTINCWPSENDGQCDVNIEYELQQEEIELKDVTITIPVPRGVGAPVVSEIEGDYHYDHKNAVLEWQIPVIDESNKTGAMEFSISAHPDDFFPINVSFGSTKSFCDVQVKDVNIVEDGMPVKFSSEVVFSVEKYEIL